MAALAPRRGDPALIDGYNIIMRHPVWASLPLAQARHQLLTALVRVRWPMPVSQITVFFDSADPTVHGDAPVATGSVRTVFATPSADAAIRHAIQHHATPRRLVVISDDREILHTAKVHGTRRYSAAWLLQRLQPPPAHAEQPASPGLPPGLSGRQMRRINDELTRRWNL